MMEAFSVIMKSSVRSVSIRLEYIISLLILSHYAAFELPQINYKSFNGRKYQFMYGLTVSTLVDPADVRLCVPLFEYNIAEEFILEIKDIEG